MTISKDIYYILIALAFGVTTLILIPKPQYKKFFIYGLLFGGAYNVFVILILSGVFHLFKYTQIGPAGIWGLFSFFTPVTFMFIFMIYLYLLPVRKIFLYPYIAVFIAFGYMFGLPLKALGMFEISNIYEYFQLVNFTVWYSLAAWAYIKSERITLK